MNLTQNDRLKQVTSDTLIVGVDVGSQTHFCRAFDWRGFELSRRVFKFSNTGMGFLTFLRWAEELMNKTEMKKVLSEPFSQYDISNGVYGMKSATLSGIEYIEESSDWSTDTLIFNCTFDNVEFTPNASNNNGNNKGACYILVHKDRDTYTISNFVSGL